MYFLKAALFAALLFKINSIHKNHFLLVYLIYKKYKKAGAHASTSSAYTAHGI